MSKKPKLAMPYQHEGFCIINPHGDVWGDGIYSDTEEAVSVLDRFWYGREKWEHTGFTLAPAASTTIVTGPERIKLP